jgi:nicotinate phosphoribosyltransferase
MAHSYIEAFPSEAEAFRAFAEDFPARTTFLVDTYDTPNGVRTAIRTARDLGLTENVAVRLDSGNLLELSRSARGLLDEAGLTDARIFASGGLEELEVEELVRDGAPVDAFGIGTQMGVSADAPYVDSVYKLVEYDGRPVLKLSSKKATAPGPKQVFRGPGGDLVALRDEPGPPGAEPLLELAMHRGERTSPPPSIEQMRERFRADLARVPEHARRLRDPGPVVVRHSGALEALTHSAREDALRRAGLEG